MNKYKGKYRKDRLFRGKVKETVSADLSKTIYKTVYSDKDGMIKIRFATYKKENLLDNFIIEWRKISAVEGNKPFERKALREKL